MKKIIFYFVVIVSIANFSSCKKEQIVKGSHSSTNLLHSTKRDIEYIRKVANSVLRPIGVNLATFRTTSWLDSVNATISYDSSSSPHVVTIDFGSGTLQPDGVFMAGVLVVRYPGNNAGFSTPDAVINLELQNVLSDTIRYNGNIDFINLGYNSNGNLYGEANADFFATITTTTNHYHFTQQLDVEEVSGINHVNGFLQIDNLTNSTSTIHTILSTLKEGNQTGCENVYVEGIVRISATGETDYDIDYGNGTCDTYAIEIRDGVGTRISIAD